MGSFQGESTVHSTSWCLCPYVIPSPIWFGPRDGLLFTRSEGMSHLRLGYKKTSGFWLGLSLICPEEKQLPSGKLANGEVSGRGTDASASAGRPWDLLAVSWVSLEALRWLQHQLIPWWEDLKPHLGSWPTEISDDKYLLLQAAKFWCSLILSHKLHAFAKMHCSVLLTQTILYSNCFHCLQCSSYLFFPFIAIYLNFIFPLRLNTTSFIIWMICSHLKLISFYFELSAL